MRVIHVVGTRPNFMKVAPVIIALDSYPSVSQTLVHTGQHYDANMSDVFFKQLAIPEPDVNLEVGSGSHAAQTAQIMIRFEGLVNQYRPDIVLVYGDVNSTLAAALVCAKLHVLVAHVEAGLRSRDRTMPEEVNRLLTDQLASLLFTPSTDGNENLAQEGIPAERVYFVGNVMIDTLVRLLPQAKDAGVSNLPERYLLVTLHRPSNVDKPDMLNRIMDTLAQISTELPVLFPVHPRTRKRLTDSGIIAPHNGRIQLIDPVGYLQFIALQRSATAVLTDSGGIQEETTYLGIPCLTVRENTERPVTVTMGTNMLVGQDMERLKVEVNKILNGNRKTGQVPPLWDGKAGKRIARILIEHSV